jgi:hypothetical protein
MPKPPLLAFKEIRDTGKTKVWDVFSSNGIRLGSVNWYAPWRRYVFEPAFATLFDRNCLMEIVEFIEKQMIARRP